MDVRIAAVAMAAAAPVATWWLVPDLSSAGFAEHELDYMVRAPAVSWAVEAVAGVAALAVLLLSIGTVARALHTGELRRAWLPTIVLPTVAGVVVGVGARMITAGGIGANIGGGLAILLGVPLVVILLVAAVVNAWHA